MSNHKKRIYKSNTRSVQAAQTKARILLHATQLFQSKGFECVTIENIAKAANISMPTIYALFKSKLGILRILMDEALPAEQFNVLVDKARQEKVPIILLNITAKIARQIYDAEKTQINIFQGASVLSPEFKILEQERERRRYKRLEATVQTIHQEQALKKDISLAKAHDVLWALTGRDIYRMLVIEQNWTSDAYETYLAQLLVVTLLCY